MISGEQVGAIVVAAVAIVGLAVLFVYPWKETRKKGLAQNIALLVDRGCCVSHGRHHLYRARCSCAYLLLTFNDRADLVEGGEQQFDCVQQATLAFLAATELDKGE